MVAHRAVSLLLSLALSIFVAAADSRADDKKPKTKWTKVPDGFRGVKFGATKAEAEAVLGRMRCVKVRAVKPSKDAIPVWGKDRVIPTPEHELCSTTDKAQAFRAGEKVIGTDYLFDEGRFVAVKLRRIETMSPSKVVLFSDVRPVFESLYGPPTEENTMHHKGTRPQTVSTWDPKQNKSVDKTYPMKVDYVQTCLRWTDAAVEIGLCSEEGGLFARGEITSAAWKERRRAWFDQ